MVLIGPVFRGAYAGGTQHRFVPKYSTSSARYGPVRRIRGNPKRVTSGLVKFQRKFRARRARGRAVFGQRPTFETKYLPVTPQNDVAPAAIQTGAKAFFKGFVMGTVPSSWSSTGINNLGGIVCAKGTDNNERVGNYVYLNHTLINLNVDTKINATDAPPLEFRVIVFRQRRQAMPAGLNPDPADSLFKSEAGSSVGHLTSGINGTDLMLQPLNKEKWIIVRDQKFTLQKPAKGTEAMGNGPYKNFKNFRFNLGYKKKAHYESANLPTNVPFHYGIFIYARSVDKTINANNWEVNLRGTTCYNDL